MFFSYPIYVFGPKCMISRILGALGSILDCGLTNEIRPSRQSISSHISSVWPQKSRLLEFPVWQYT